MHVNLLGDSKVVKLNGTSSRNFELLINFLATSDLTDSSKMCPFELMCKSLQ